MNILALETATQVASVALKVDGRVWDLQVEDAAARAETVLDLVRAILGLAKTDLSAVQAIAFGRGPGSFTGIRVATAVAQGLAYGRGVPVIPISSLAALAQGAKAPHIAAAIDARRDEIYYGFFRRQENGLVIPMGPEQLGKPGLLQVPAGAYRGAGSGFDHYADVLDGVCAGGYEAGLVPTAASVLLLAEEAYAQGAFTSACQAAPVYLRDDVACAS